MVHLLRFGRLYHAHIKRLLYIVTSISAAIGLLHLFAYPSVKYYLIASDANVGLVSLTKPISINSEVSEPYSTHYPESDANEALASVGADQMSVEFNEGTNVCSHGSAKCGHPRGTISISSVNECLGSKPNLLELRERSHSNSAYDNQETSGCSIEENVGMHTALPPLHHKLGSQKSALTSALSNSFLLDNKDDMHEEPKLKNSGLLQGDSIFLKNIPVMASNPALQRRGRKSVSITQMNALLLRNSSEMKLKRTISGSAHDQELQDARFKIQFAPVERNISEIHASLFRNYSMFKRSYELMEKRLRVYVYKEGEKPIFHNPYLRGIYASEGWFMKLMERNKQFVVKDPRKAHLFYLPFSSLRLRNALNGTGPGSRTNMENYLKKYLDLIAAKYHFWNRRGGADHFFVSCHDWAPRLTMRIFGSCIRVLCNSNVAKGFQIRKDVSLPVTYIRSAENPLKDLGGNPVSNRPFLAFFAGGMHGDVRPILLQHWHNKERDMVILGPMPRDPEGKATYKNFMKSSKYCISAKGYEVHTPRVIESIYYECVPVIISDNYVPPFFEVLNWEAFSLFVSEDDIPNLRDILLSVPNDRYLLMQRRLKAVQQYFLWHKVPLKYDLFHMTLHSIWYNRVFQFPARL